MPELRNLHRIFVVDDEPAIASTLARILCSHGYDATPFTGSTEALLAAQSGAPHLLLTDASMPSMSGVELGIEVRKCSPDCKVLVLSGQPAASPLFLTHSSTEHEFEFLQKPIHPANLLGKIRFMTEKPMPPQSATLWELEQLTA
jgi:DNA-binding NtrC family response regulator